VSSIDWKSLFVSKYKIDRLVSGLLGSILASQTGRIEKFRSVIDLGYDAKDTLLRHSLVASGDDHLARRWATDSVQLAFLSVKLTEALWQPKGIMLAHS
jgi:F-box protein 21